MVTSTQHASQFDPQKYPVHVWLEILEPLLYQSERSKESLYDSDKYQPFQNTPIRTHEYLDNGAQCTSGSSMDVVSLLLVCKAWYNILSPSLYRNIRIHHGADGLLQGLRRQVVGNSVTYGTFVQHVEVNVDPLDQIVVLSHILTCCAKVRSLTQRRCTSKPSASGSPNESSERKADTSWTTASLKGAVTSTNLPILPNLHRLEWWDRENAVSRIESTPFLHTLIQQAPNLRYLSLFRSAQKGWLWGNPFCQGMLIPTQRSHSITTLRLEGCNDPLDLFRLDLPNLTHLIIPQPSESPIECPSGLGRQIKILEITASHPGAHRGGGGGGGGMTSDYVLSRLWTTFPNIRELALPLSTALEFADAQTSVATLGDLRVLMLDVQGGKVHGSEAKGCASGLGNNVEDFLGGKLKLPRLENVVLHGSSESWCRLPSCVWLHGYLRLNQALELELLE